MMLRKYLSILLGVSLLVHVANAGFRSRTFRDQPQQRGSYFRASSGELESSNQKNAKSTLQEGSQLNSNSKGISAWGIIAIVVGLILLGTGGYYAFVFYPYICKKQRSYDMIELTNVL